MNTAGPMLFCGDSHGVFRHIIRAAESMQPSAVFLLGNMEPQRPLHIELAPLIERQVPLWYIHGNHDADSDDLWRMVWGSVAERQSNCIQHIFRTMHLRLSLTRRARAQKSRGCTTSNCTQHIYNTIRWRLKLT